MIILQQKHKGIVLWLFDATPPFNFAVPPLSINWNQTPTPSSLSADTHSHTSSIKCCCWLISIYLTHISANWSEWIGYERSDDLHAVVVQTAENHCSCSSRAEADGCSSCLLWRNDCHNLHAQANQWVLCSRELCIDYI